MIFAVGMATTELTSESYPHQNVKVKLLLGIRIRNEWKWEKIDRNCSSTHFSKKISLCNISRTQYKYHFYKGYDVFVDTSMTLQSGWTVEM